MVLPFSLTAGAVATLIGAGVGLGWVASGLHSLLDILASVLFVLLANAVAVGVVRSRADQFTRGLGGFDKPQWSTEHRK